MHGFLAFKTSSVTLAACLAGAVAAGAGAGAVLGSQGARSPDVDRRDPSRFVSGVELVIVTATVTDAGGRFVSGLRQQDFAVFEDDQPQELTHFSSERVPVSLGVALDTSGSVTADKLSAARAAIDRFALELLGQEDEMFLAQFASTVQLVHEWTRDRRALVRILARLPTGGGTALYDAIAHTVPIAQTGRNQKKALVIISDGNDTGSEATPHDVRRQVRESDVLVYAIGVDGQGAPVLRPGGRAPRRPFPLPLPPFPFPVPGRRPPPVGGGGAGGIWTRPAGDGVDPAALRAITDDTGGRTEIVREFGDLGGATARIANELGRQYSLGYVRPGANDGRWHRIRVDVRGRRDVVVRARGGYLGS